jgi:hypothetical protein
VSPRATLGLVAVLSGTFLTSAAPTLLWGDDAELQRIAITGEVRAIGQSSAASHLLWQTVASAFVRWTTWVPLDEAGRVTLVSSIAAALALLPPALTIREISRQAGLGTRASAIGSVVGAVAFGLSHTFWLLASRPDAYTIQVMLLAIALWGAVQAAQLRRLRTGVVVCLAAVGLALTNHVLILASVPGLAIVSLARARLSVRHAVALAGAGCIALGGAIGVAEVVSFPWRALVGAIVSYRPYIPSVRDAVLVVGYLAYQYPLSIMLMGFAWVPLRRIRPAVSVGLAVMYLAVVGLMLFRYHPEMYVRDQYIFYLPSYLPVTVVIGLGAGWVVENPPAWLRVRGPWLIAALIAMACAPVVVYPLAATVAGPIATRLAPSRVLPGRDPIWYYLWPPKSGYTGARDFVSAAFEVLPPGAVVVADWLPYQPMRYVQAVEGGRPDVRLEMINAGDGRQLTFLKAQSAETPLFLADISPPPYYEIDDIRECFDIEVVGVVYRLRRKGGC